MDDKEINSLVERWQKNRDETALFILNKELSGYFKYLENSANLKSIDVEIILNDSFFVAVNTFEIGKGNFLGYLAFIFKRRLINAKRFANNSRRKELKLFSSDKEKEYLEKIDEGVVIENKRNELYEAIKGLSEREQLILKMFLEGHTQKEIGLKIKISKSRMNGIMTQAIHNLKRILL